MALDLTTAKMKWAWGDPSNPVAHLMWYRWTHSKDLHNMIVSLNDQTQKRPVLIWIKPLTGEEKYRSYQSIAEAVTDLKKHLPESSDSGPTPEAASSPANEDTADAAAASSPANEDTADAAAAESPREIVEDAAIETIIEAAGRVLKFDKEVAYVKHQAAQRDLLEGLNQIQPLIRQALDKPSDGDSWDRECKRLAIVKAIVIATDGKFNDGDDDKFNKVIASSVKACESLESKVRRHPNLEEMFDKAYKEAMESIAGVRSPTEPETPDPAPETPPSETPASETPDSLFKWQQIERDQLLPQEGVINSGKTDKDGDVYVARVCRMAGKLNLKDNKMWNIWCHGILTSAQRGEVLVLLGGAEYEWKFVRKGVDTLPDGAVLAGVTPKDGENYVARCCDTGECGKVNLENGKIHNFWAHSYWFSRETCEVLCIKK